MDQAHNILGWNIFDEVVSVEQSTNDLSPQEQMFESIRKKDAEQLTAAISLGANPKVLVGKEKMAVFAIRNFSVDVIKVLQKSGVSFKDFYSMESAVFEMDHLEAFHWIVENKNKKSKTDISEFLLPAAELGACNVFNEIVEKMDEAKKAENFKFVSAQMSSALISNALTMGNEKTLTYLFEMKNSNQLEHIFKIFWEHTKCSKIQLQNLHKTLNTLPHIIPAFKASIQHIRVSVSPYERLNIRGFEEIYKPQEYSLKANGIATLLEFLVYQNNDVVIDAFSQKSAKEKMAQIMEQRGKFFISFLAIRANRDVRQGILKNTKDVWCNWRDEHGSNVFHYLASRSSPPKTLCEDLYTLDSDLLITPNDAGETPLMSFSAEHAAAVTKKMMKKELRSTGVTVSNTRQSSGRRM